MSVETKAAVDEAIAAHFADEMGGALVQGYIVQVCGDSLEDMANELWSAQRIVPEGQSFITSLGLAAYIKRNLEVAMTDYERE